MNPRLLKKVDLTKAYEVLTGTVVDKGQVTRKEMESHLEHLKEIDPLAAHVAIVGALYDDERMVEESMKEIEAKFYPAYIPPKVSDSALRSLGVEIRDPVKVGRIEPVIEPRPDFEVVDSGENWVLISKYGYHSVRLIDHKGEVIERYMGSYESAEQFIETIPPPEKPYVYEEDFVTLETGMKWIH